MKEVKLSPSSGVTEDDNFSIDAVKMKNDIQAQIREDLNGDFSIENRREFDKKMIREGKSLLYKSVEEYEELCRIADAKSKI